MLGNSNRVEQSDINAEKVIARDYIDNTMNIHYYGKNNSYSGDLTLRKLLEAHELERQNNPEYQNFSDELNNFFKQKTEKKSRDLTQKLLDGNREYLIDLALESKEKVAKSIYKFQHYPSAQKVYTHLLTNIRSSFKHLIESRIKSGKFEAFEIDDFVKEKVIEPFYQTVQGSSLYIDLDDLYGLLYLLTGNCHIDWD